MTTIAKMDISSARAAFSDKAHLPSFTSEIILGSLAEFEQSFSTTLSKWKSLVIGCVLATDTAANRVSDVLMEVAIGLFKFVQLN